MAVIQKKNHKNMMQCCFQAIEEDMEMRQAALDSVKLAAEELLKQAGNDQDEAVRGKWQPGSGHLYEH